MTTANCTAQQFLTANEIKTFDDIANAGTIATMWPIDAIADSMLADWKFDGAMVPDRAELVAAIKMLPSLFDSETTALLGFATAAQFEASMAAGPEGHILIDDDGDVVDPGGFYADTARKVFVA